MAENSDKIDIFANQFPEEQKQNSRPWKWGVFAFVVVLFIGVLFTNAFLQRKFLISHIKKQIAYSIDALNQFGWDIAYDNISFNAFPLLSLGEMSNVKIYNRYKRTSWNIEKIDFDNSILNAQKIYFDISGKQFLTYENKVHKISADNLELFIEVENNSIIRSISLKMLNFSLADWFDIDEIVFLAHHIPSENTEFQIPYFKSAIELTDIKLNGLLNYPLSQTIRKIYLNSDIIGKISFSKNFRSNLREWMAKDGHIKINDFNINWSPLLLVGKGNLYLNENFEPILQLNTTSKALSVLIDDLERLNWLDSKGVFVTKILLATKSYKSNETDKYLTVTTPISLRDDALLIEKIAVKKFN